MFDFLKGILSSESLGGSKVFDKTIYRTMVYIPVQEIGIMEYENKVINVNRCKFELFVGNDTNVRGFAKGLARTEKDGYYIVFQNSFNSSNKIISKRNLDIILLTKDYKEAIEEMVRNLPLDTISDVYEYLINKGYDIENPIEYL